MTTRPLRGNRQEEEEQDKCCLCFRKRNVKTEIMLTFNISAHTCCRGGDFLLTSCPIKLIKTEQQFSTGTYLVYT